MGGVIDEVLTDTDFEKLRVAPATLTFHGVTDLRIELDWGSSGFQVVPSLIPIYSIERELVKEQKVYLDRPYYSWRINLSAPPEGSITFGAVGFTQKLRAEPIVTSNQHLTLRERESATRR
jgi:hypothetical protein